MLIYTRSEEFIYRLLKSLGVVKPHEMTLENIAKLLNIKVRYWEFSSETIFHKGKFILFLEGKENKQEQWQEFAHELCHHFWHTGRQEYLPKLFMQLQEYQADYFAYHFCVPTFMLDNLKEVSVCKIMDLFNVEEEFAYRRLEMYQNKQYARSASL